MRRVIVLGTSCGDIAGSVGRAFRNLGWDPEVVLFAPDAERSALARARNLLVPARRLSASQPSFSEAVTARVLPLLRSRVDLVVILNGDRLSSDAERGLRDGGVPIIAWMYDSMVRCAWGESVVRLAHHAFCVDGADARGPRLSWLPLGADEELFHPQAQPKDLDVLFVGTVGASYSRRRQRLLELAHSSLPKRYRCAFVGSAGDVLLNARLLVTLRRGSVEWMARRLPPRALGEHIARSKVCVNILQDDGSEPVNPLFAAIPACGTCQLAEARSHLRRWLTPARDYVEFRDDAFLTTLERLLRDDDERRHIDEHGLRSVTRDHTVTQRVRELLSRVELRAEAR